MLVSCRLWYWEVSYFAAGCWLRWFYAWRAAVVLLGGLGSVWCLLCVVLVGLSG